MPVQIIGLRDYVDPKEPTKIKKREHFYNKKWRLATVKDVFTKTDWLEPIPEEDRFNLYFTVAEVEEARGRKLTEQWVIPFDIDKLDMTDANCEEVAANAARIALASIKVKYSDASVIFSGNGVQFFVHLDSPITDPDFFDRARGAYAGVCRIMQLALSKAGVSGHVDTTVFSHARLMRLPNTQNIKKGKPTRTARVLSKGTTPHVFDMFAITGITEMAKGQVLPDLVIKNYPKPDTKAVCEGCLFLKTCKEKPEAITEPLWYAMLSITARLENGEILSHEYSEGHPDYSEYETEEKIRQAQQSAGPRTCKDIETRWGGCTECEHYGKITSPIMLRGPSFIASKDFGYRERKVKGNSIEPGRVVFADLALMFEQTHTYTYINDNDTIMVFNGTHWEPMNKSAIMAWMHARVVPEASAAEAMEFYHRLCLKNQRTLKQFNSRVDGCLNFINGVYDLKTGELHKHASDFGFTYVLPHGYFADAPAPLFEQFLKDVTQDNEDLATLIKEYIGYAMSNDEPWLQKCAVLIGTGANGKSVLVDTIAEIVGRHNTAGVFFKDLVKPEARMTLINKLMCISEETTVGAFQDSDVFKQLVTGGSILVKELYKQAYSATIKAKLFILCNEMPSSRDRTHGMFRRMMVIPFNAVFTKGDGKHDPDIKKKLMSEASGIFRTCMDAYASVRLRGGFTEPSASVDALARYIDENNPVHDFLEDECITVTGAQTDVVKVKEVYGAYVDYCKAAYLKPINNKFFGKMLLSADSRIQATRNTTSRLYTGVKLNKNF